MNKRKLLLAALALCMVAILAVGGSLAYLTDEEQANNTMVIGDIEIDIEELVYVDGELKTFVNDAFTLYPIDNAQGMELYNKMVYTYNTSKVTANDSGYAYIRTLVAFEDIGVAGAVHWANDTVTNGKFHGSVMSSYVNDVEINGQKYDVVVFEEVAGKAIAPDEALQSIYSVWLDKDLNNEEVAKFGDKIEILVLSQGIQAAGLSHDQAMAELGEIADDEASRNLVKGWFEGTEVVDGEINDGKLAHYAPVVTAAPAEGTN